MFDYIDMKQPLARLVKIEQNYWIFSSAENVLERDGSVGMEKLFEQHKAIFKKY